MTKEHPEGGNAAQSVETLDPRPCGFCHSFPENPDIAVAPTITRRRFAACDNFVRSPTSCSVRESGRCSGRAQSDPVASVSSEIVRPRTHEPVWPLSENFQRLSRYWRLSTNGQCV